ncbi:HAMP domain-containing sensor histidine kinase [Chryseobacterium koreense]|uniref:sensor histidine kinase n=1 Tax=Chryseobacterium koreense TaxID=232216 RepID=UPI0026EA7BB7|nr:HAMP domain-containing sensor histidine kinase [Chryseobacterium koreense]
MRKQNFFSKINIWVVYGLFSAIVFGVAIYSVALINELRQREANRISVFAQAMKIQQANQTLDSDTQNLLFTIFKENDRLPIVVVDQNRKAIVDEGFYRNIPEEIVKDPQKLSLLIADMGSRYKPFELEISERQKQYVYYDNSKLLNNLRYFPYLLGFFILGYIFFSLWFLRTIKKTDEGYVWAGLAKETAHQIGTPLSSMIGWIEILRMENENSEGVKEIEKDINRLKTISERFSKIGSVPELNDLNVNETLQQNYDYLKSRISKKVKFMLVLPNHEILIPHNRILLSWVIENIVKNAVDAMKGEGRLEIELYEKNKNVLIDFKDSGSGMTNSQARNAFKAGYSTKKRGWGLGLSLAKRVIKEYHRGDIRIAHTAVGEGSTFRIMMRNG